MQTCKPISTISYNTKNFLINKLTELIDKGIIDWACLIEHQPEEDEKKSHFHVYIILNRRVDTKKLQNEFREIDPNSELPLCCLPFQSVKKFCDWYFYGLHDPVYLASKGQRRKHIYRHEDMISSDYDYLQQLVSECDVSQYNFYFEIKKYQMQGYSFHQFLVIKNIPVNQINAYKEAWFVMETFVLETNRNGRTPHDMYDINNYVELKKEDNNIEEKDIKQIEEK